MSRLFETTEINGMKLANRFVRSATWEGMAAEDGACTSRLVDRAAGVGIFGTHHRRLYELAPGSVVYKPCGAGGGDFGIACTLDAGALAGFEAAAVAAGYLPMRMEIAPHGVDVSITR